MAIAFFSHEGSNTSPYDTPAKAANLPSSALTYLKSQSTGPHTLYGKIGVYNDPVHNYLSGSYLNNMTISGVKEFTFFAPANKYELIIKGPSDYPVLVWASSTSGQVINNICFDGCNVLQGGPNDTVTLSASGQIYNNCGFINSASGLSGARWIIKWEGANITLNRCYGYGAASSTSAIYVDSSGSGSINSSEFSNKHDKLLTLGNGIQNSGAGVLKINNSLIMGQGSSVLLNNGTGHIESNNCILVASPLLSPTGVPLAGDVRSKNDIIIGRWGGGWSTVTGAATTTNALINKRIGFKNHAKSGYIIPRIDDTESYANGWMTEFAQLLKIKGVTGTSCVSPATLSGDYLAQLTEAINIGSLEIAAHGYSHSEIKPLTYTNIFVSGVVKSGSTINIDRVSDTISISGSNPLSNFKSKTLAEIIVYFTSCGCTVPSLAAHINQLSLGEIISSSSGDMSLVSPGYNPSILYDDTGDSGFYFTEIVYAKSTLESIIGRSVDTFITPFNSTNEQSSAIAKSNGYKCYSTSFTNTTRNKYDLSSIDVFNLGCIWGNTIIDTDIDVIKGRVRILCEAISQGGLVIPLLAHNYAGPEVTIDQWTLIFDLIQSEYPEIKICSFSDFAADVANSGLWSTSDNRVFNRVFVDRSDYHIASASDLIGAGIKIPGITADIEGNQLYPPYNIGPYGMEAGVLGVAPVVNDGQPRNNITRLTGTSNTIDPAGTYILDDTNAWRVVMGWTAGTANFAFDANGVPIAFTGQQLIDAGVGPKFYCGLKGVAGYVVDQDAPTNAKIIKILKVPTYIDTLYWADYQEFNWEPTSGE